MRTIKLKDKNYKIAIGTVNFGLKYGIKSNKKIGFSVIKKIITKAKKNHIKFIDTSQIYKSAEKILGKFDLINFKIITKVKFYEKKIIDPKKIVYQKIDKSLKDLNIKKLDTVLFHNYKDCLRPESKDIYNCLKKIKNEGKIDKIGISINSPEEFFKVNKYFRFDVVQSPLNIFDRRLITSGLKKKLDKYKTQVMIRSIYLQGLLLMDEDQRPSFFTNKHLWNSWHKWLKKNNFNKKDIAVNFALKHIKKKDILLTGLDNQTQLNEFLNTKIQKKFDIPNNLHTTNSKIIEPSNWKY